jgi:dipeptidyl aminopeptidase/acylaminoacyl peptidase
MGGLLLHQRLVIAAPSIDDFGNLPQVELMRVSPSGNHIALIGVDHGKRQLLIADSADNKVLKAAVVGENKVRDVQWSGDEHLLVTITATSERLYDFGNERYELAGVLHVGMDARAPWAVFDHSDDIEHAVFGFEGTFSEQGHWYGYFNGWTRVRERGFGDTGYTRQNAYLDLYKVDLETSKPTLVAKGVGAYHEWAIGADGQIVAHSEYSAGSGEWILYGGKSREKALLKRTSPRRDVSLIGLGRTDRTVLVLDQTGAEDQALEIEVDSGRSEAIVGDSGVSHFLFDPLTGHLIGAATYTDPWARFFDPSLQKHYNSVRKAFADRHVRIASFSPGLKDMIVFTDGTADSGTYWYVDGATHHADPVGYPYPGIKPADVGAVAIFAYDASDGTPIEGILTTPPDRGAKNLPLVVLPHGGPIGEFDEIGFDWLAQAFASRGYAVFQPNYRGSGGKTAAFRKAGYGEWGRKILSDISDGVAALAAKGMIDPKRACIVGASYGGYAALAGVTLQKGIYRCAVSVAGPSDMTSLLSWEAKIHGLDSPELRYWKEVTGADRGPGALREISPIQFVKHLEVPVLLIHGKDDTRVPFDQSRDMASALKNSGKEFSFVELENEDHFLSRDSTRTTMLKSALSFVQKYNPSK